MPERDPEKRKGPNRNGGAPHGVSVMSQRTRIPSGPTATPREAMVGISFRCAQVIGDFLRDGRARVN
jgi:hypothetical protein